MTLMTSTIAARNTTDHGEMRPIDFLKLIRVRQWVKNLFLFLPLIFGGRLLSSSDVWHGLEAFICFSFAASSIYVVNDILDRKADREHPVKHSRPIASGRVSVTLAGGIAALLAVLAFQCCQWFFPLSSGVLLIVVAYVVINLLYSCWLKRYAIIDVMMIAAGFVLRVLAGGAACDIPVSPWLTVMVFMLTLFIAFAKRRDDLVRMIGGKGVVRRSVAGYSLGFIDQTMSLLASAMIVAYIIYTLQPDVEERFGSSHVYLTTLFVIAEILRYLQIAIVKKDSGQPTKNVYSDPFLVGCVVCWIFTFMFIIYC